MRIQDMLIWITLTLHILAHKQIPMLTYPENVRNLTLHEIEALKVNETFITFS